MKTTQVSPTSYPIASAPPMPMSHSIASLPTVIAINTIKEVSNYSHDKPIYRGLLMGENTGAKHNFFINLNKKPVDFHSTVGTDFKIKRFQQFSGQVWEMSSQPRFQAMADSYEKNAHFALVFANSDSSNLLTRLSNRAGWKLFTMTYTLQPNGTVQTNFSPLETVQVMPNNAQDMTLSTTMIDDILDASMQHVQVHSIMALRGATAPTAAMPIIATTGMQPQIPVAITIPFTEAEVLPNY